MAHLITPGSTFKHATSRGRVQHTSFTLEQSENPFIALENSLVAFQGEAQFEHEEIALTERLKRAVTREGIKLMRITNQGEVTIASDKRSVVVVELTDEPFTVDTRFILGFDSTLEWGMEMTKGFAGGAFNTTLTGTGIVVLAAEGEFLEYKLELGSEPVYIDTAHLVAWSTDLSIDGHHASKLVGVNAVENFQIKFEAVAGVNGLTLARTHS